jgi:hypothetical protein
MLAAFQLPGVLRGGGGGRQAAEPGARHAEPAEPRAVIRSPRLLYEQVIDLLTGGRTVEWGHVDQRELRADRALRQAPSSRAADRVAGFQPKRPSGQPGQTLVMGTALAPAPWPVR